MFTLYKDIYYCLSCRLYIYNPYYSQAEPRNVLLVHGEAAKMEFLKQKINQEFGKE